MEPLVGGVLQAYVIITEMVGIRVLSGYIGCWEHGVVLIMLGDLRFMGKEMPKLSPWREALYAWLLRSQKGSYSGGAPMCLSLWK